MGLSLDGQLADGRPRNGELCVRKPLWRPLHLLLPSQSITVALCSTGSAGWTALLR